MASTHLYTIQCRATANHPSAQSYPYHEFLVVAESFEEAKTFGRAYITTLGGIWEYHTCYYKADLTNLIKGKILD